MKIQWCVLNFTFAYFCSLIVRTVSSAKIFEIFVTFSKAFPSPPRPLLVLLALPNPVDFVLFGCRLVQLRHVPTISGPAVMPTVPLR